MLTVGYRFSALQRAEIAEIVSSAVALVRGVRFSALQRAEIAEMSVAASPPTQAAQFQCSSTSRNC